VAIAGPLLTAPGGYPSRSWGAAGFAGFLDDPAQTERLVAGLTEAGVDVVKLALEPSAGPVPSAEICRVVVATAALHGLSVVAHALTVPAVEQALDAGVAELAHTPTEPLPAEIVQRIAERRVSVTSTLHAFADRAPTAGLLDNAGRLLEAGVVMHYGTDLGNHGIAPGVDPKELDLLADTGLGRAGALRMATSSAAAGLAAVDAPNGRIEPGRPAALVALAADPLQRPAAWRRPIAVVAGGQIARLVR
jgi:imidazolonepropionase-like amidohydrolase